MDHPDIDKVVDAIHEFALNVEKLKTSQLHKAIEAKFGECNDEAVALVIKELSFRLYLLWCEFHG